MTCRGWTIAPATAAPARFLAQATADAGRDTESMRLWDPVKIIEVMGRNAAGARGDGAGCRRRRGRRAHLIYLPERPLVAGRFLADVERVHRALGYAVVVVAETVRDEHRRHRPAAGRGGCLRPSPGGRHRGSALRPAGRRLGAESPLRQAGDNSAHVYRVCLTGQSRRPSLPGREAVRLALAGQSGRMVALDRAPQSA